MFTGAQVALEARGNGPSGVLGSWAAPDLSPGNQTLYKSSTYAHCCQAVISPEVPIKPPQCYFEMPLLTLSLHMLLSCLAQGESLCVCF